MSFLLKNLFKLATLDLKPYISIILPLCFILELVISYCIISFIPYTEIDWRAYMQEVGSENGFLSGDWNYSNLKGDTGPLVYPAGFVYIYSILYTISDHGTNIQMAQYIFMIFHACFITVFLKLLSINCRHLPLWMIVCTCISRRIHSIFVLRLFNDCFAVFFCYLSLLVFSYSNYNKFWRISLGSVIYSFAVSIKMNILLYAPAIGLLYYKCLGFQQSMVQILLCILVQCIIGSPFLYSYPLAYINNAFNLSKDFKYQWTVNFKFLDESLFLNRTFGHMLLFTLLLSLLMCAHFIWCEMLGVFGFLMKYWTKNTKNVDYYYFLDRFFLCNLLGIIFAKSLHFQFYVWYFHTIPYLAWRSTLPLVMKWVVVLGIEVVWNIFPANAISSAVLWVLHLMLLFCVLQFQYNYYNIHIYRKKKF